MGVLNEKMSYYDEQIKQQVVKYNIRNTTSSINEFWYLCTGTLFFKLLHDYFINNIVNGFSFKNTINPPTYLFLSLD